MTALSCFPMLPPRMTSPTPFRDLLALEGVEEHLVLRGPIGFMAYHGGSLEEMTDVIASAAASASPARAT